jgi:hypothetical protein
MSGRCSLQCSSNQLRSQKISAILQSQTITYGNLASRADAINHKPIPSYWLEDDLLRNAGFEIVGYHEPKPKNLSRGHDDPTKYYSIQKAEKIPCSFIFVCKK